MTPDQWEYSSFFMAFDLELIQSKLDYFDKSLTRYLNEGWAPIGGISITISDQQCIAVQALIRKVAP